VGMGALRVERSVVAWAAEPLPPEGLRAAGAYEALDGGSCRLEQHTQLQGEGLSSKQQRALVALGVMV
jgi:hypothetical protein